MASDHPPSYYVQNIPAWWAPDQMPEQATTGMEHMLEIYETFSRKGINGRFAGLLIHGGPGVGKTSAALGWGYFWATAGRGHVRFQDFEELMSRMTIADRFNHHETRDDIYEEMYQPTVLILDDLGKRTSADHALVASTLVNGRINRGSQKKQRITLSTTNCNLGTTEGRAQFSAACDGRVLQRYTSLDVDAKQWGSKNLRELGR